MIKKKSTVINRYSKSKKKLKVTIICDKSSWLLEYLNILKSILIKEGHKTKIVFNPKDITNGDILLILSFSKILSNDNLKKNISNIVVHESKLPVGKGWSPLSWQVLENKNVIPITLFEANQKIDNGKIYIQDVIQLKGNELVDEIRSFQAKKTIDLCLNFIANFPKILFNGKSQKGKSSYYKKRTPLDSKIDINKSIKEQFNLLRIVDNKRYPAYFFFKGKKYILKIIEGENK